MCIRIPYTHYIIYFIYIYTYCTTLPFRFLCVWLRNLHYLGLMLSLSKSLIIL